jgi:hypothetical protein
MLRLHRVGWGKRKTRFLVSMRRKKIRYELLLSVMVFLLSLLTLSAQSPFDPAYLESAKAIDEELQVFTDRSMYIVDEDIQFVADHRVEVLKAYDNWSSTLYVELVTADGKPVAQEKFSLSKGRVQGSLHVPSMALTGDYLLKCYTRWMRNQGPASFFYTPLKIINPFRKEISVVSGEAASGSAPGRIPYRDGILGCSTSSTQYKGGEEVILNLAMEEQVIQEALACCVTVVPEGSIDFSGGYDLGEHAEDTPEPFRVTYLPDLGGGLSLSGSVVGPDQLPVPFTTLHFSLLGEHPDYFAAISDEKGRFNLASTRGAGKQEFFVTPEQYKVADLEIRIDQEYDKRPLHFPAGEFSLSVDEREVARKLSLNMQLSKAYRTSKTSDAEAGSKGGSHSAIEVPFYGTRVKKLMIDDYVRLPNMEEVFINLVPEVQIFKKRGKTGIRIVSENNSIGVYQPLIMIDNISVFDVEAILALSPEKIERIDLINDIYLKGSVAFGGLLAIYSRKGDMAGIDLPQGSYFFDVQGVNLETPAFRNFPPARNRVPDTRNTVYWNDEVLLERGGTIDISFQAPAGKGKYVILLRAVSADGEIFMASSKFAVE